MSRVSGCLPTQIPDTSASGLALMADSSGNTSWQFPLGVQAPTAPAVSGKTLVSTGNGTAAWKAAVAAAVTTLTFGASIAVDASLGNNFAVTLTSSAGTLTNPTNPVDGQTIRVRVIQNNSGNWTLAYGNAYDFGTAGAPTLSTAGNAVDILGFEYVASLSKWCYLGSGLGF